MRAIFLAFLIPPLLPACSKPAEQADIVRPALVFSVVEGGDAHVSAYSGEIRARREAGLGFRVGGKVAARKVEVGDTVTAGQSLGQIDPADALSARREAEAQLAGAESEAGNAAAELARAQKLVEKKFLSPSALDARANAASTADARLAAARAQRDIAANQSRYTTLTADAPGIVTATNFEAGQVVGAGQEVLRIAYAGDREAHVRVGEAQARQLKPGAAVRVRLWSAPQQIYAGTVREIAPAADEQRTYLVKVTLDKPDAAVRLGMTASVSLPGGIDGPAIRLPAGALMQQGGKPAVWVVGAGDEVAAVPVEVVQYRDSGMLVRGSLPAGSRVVAAGAHKLVAGQKVRPVPYGQMDGNRS